MKIGTTEKGGNPRSSPEGCGAGAKEIVADWGQEQQHHHLSPRWQQQVRVVAGSSSSTTGALASSSRSQCRLAAVPGHGQQQVGVVASSSCTGKMPATAPVCEERHRPRQLAVYDHAVGAGDQWWAPKGIIDLQNTHTGR